jgi:hypothetical protein
LQRLFVGGVVSAVFQSALDEVRATIALPGVPFSRVVPSSREGRPPPPGVAFPLDMSLTGSAF